MTKMFSLFTVLLTLSYCKSTYSQTLILSFDPMLFDAGETVIVSCEPGDSLPLEWHNISKLTLSYPSSSNELYSLSRNCTTNATTTTGDERIQLINDFELKWQTLNKQDAATYVCSLVECDTTATYKSANTGLKFLDLVEPSLQSPSTNTYAIQDKQSVEVVCQVSKTALVDGDQLLIEHIVNGSVFDTKTVNSTTDNKLLNASYSFTPTDKTNRVTNYFNCSNVNKHRPDVKVTKHVLTVHVDYQTTTLQFSGAERVNDEGTEFKVDLTNTSLKVQCVADGIPPPTYKVRQMSGPTDAVFIENNEIDIAYETMPVTEYHLRFRCDAQYNSSTGLPSLSKTGYLNVYTSSSCRNEPALLASLFMVLVLVVSLVN